MYWFPASLTKTGICPIPSEATHDHVVLAIDEWPPFFSKNMKEYGLTPHVIKEAFAAVGVKTQYVIRPWKRCLDKAGAANWNGSPGWIKTPERLKNFYFSAKPVLTSKIVLFHRKDAPLNWDTYDDLKGMIIGGTLGYSYGKEFDKYEKEGMFTVERAAKDVYNIKKLFKKRIKLNFDKITRQKQRKCIKCNYLRCF